MPSLLLFRPFLGPANLRKTRKKPKNSLLYGIYGRETDRRGQNTVNNRMIVRFSVRKHSLLVVLRQISGPNRFRVLIFGGTFCIGHGVFLGIFAMFRLGSVADPISGSHQIRRWRYGRIVMQAGRLVEIQHRLSAGSVSIAQVWWQSKYGRSDDDLCWLDYHQPLGMPRFLTLDYVHSGRAAGYKSFIGAIHILSEIARTRNALAIVAHVSNGNISDRLLQRTGWERHLSSWKGRHWIRRFYDGYPDFVLDRYLADLSSTV